MLVSVEVLDPAEKYPLGIKSHTRSRRLRKPCAKAGKFHLLFEQSADAQLLMEKQFYRGLQHGRGASVRRPEQVRHTGHGDVTFLHSPEECIRRRNGEIISPYTRWAVSVQVGVVSS